MIVVVPPAPVDYRLSSDRAADLVRRYLPRGWTYKAWNMPAGYGVCRFAERTIETRPITTHFMAGVFFHEVGHAIMHSSSPDGAIPPHIIEFEAEVYAIRTMREEGLHVSHVYRALARRNVRWYLLEDSKKDFEINEAVIDWATKDDRPEIAAIAIKHVANGGEFLDHHDPKFLRKLVR